MSSNSSPGMTFDEDALEARLIWLWSTPFAGASELHAEICGRLEPDVVQIRQSRVAAHLLPRIDEPVEIDGTVYAAALNMLRAPYPGYAFSDAFAHTWRPEFRRLVLARLWASVARAGRGGIDGGGMPAVVLDESDSSYGLGSVMSLFPRSRMTLLAGDPFDAVAAALAGSAPAARSPELADSTAMEWCCVADAAQATLETHDPALVQIVLAAGPEPDRGGTLDRKSRRRVEEIVGDRFERLAAR
jgi:hypothetical protein